MQSWKDYAGRERDSLEHQLNDAEAKLDAVIANRDHWVSLHDKTAVQRDEWMALARDRGAELEQAQARFTALQDKDPTVYHVSHLCCDALEQARAERDQWLTGLRLANDKLLEAQAQLAQMSLVPGEAATHD